MKNIIIAIMTVYCGLNAAEIDFDGKNSKVNVHEYINRTLKESSLSIPDVEITDKTKDIKVEVNYAIMSTIKYCEKNDINNKMTDELKKLFLYGKEEEKLKFVRSDEYFFPKEILNMDISNLNELMTEKVLLSKSINRMCEQICSKWENTTVCRDKEIWQTACVSGAVVCYVAAGAHCGPAGAVCTLVNRIVPECVNVPVCKETQEICSPGL
ncbi:MAG: hypothetical protein AB1637_04670 [Elusimicrobiota bacterium]